MIHVEIDFDQSMVDSTMELLEHIPRGGERAMARALNRTVVGARADIVQAIFGGYEVRAKDVRSAIKIRKANYSNLSAAVESAGSVIELIKFKHSPSKRINPPPKIGVRVRVQKGGSMTPNPGTFLANINGPGIFRRITEARDSELERLYGPAVPSMMKTVLDDDGEQHIQDKAEDRMMRELRHEVDFMLSRGA